MDTLSRLLGRTFAFDDFCALAAARAQIWRLIAGVLTFGGALVLMVMGASLALPWIWPEIDLAAAGDITRREGVLFALGSFLFWPIALALTLAIWHRRSLRSLLSAERRIHFKPYLLGMLIALSAGVLTILIGAALVGMPEPAFVGRDWPLLAAAACGLLVVQTGVEELFFRGYLQQQLGARVRSGLWWGVLPSLMFGLLHWSPNSVGDAAGIVVLTTGVFGLVMAVIVARTGDLSLAMGLHLGVNLVALLLVAPADHLSGLALFTWPDAPEVTRTLGWLDLSVLMGLGLIALFRDQWRRNRSDLPQIFS